MVLGLMISIAQQAIERVNSSVGEVCPSILYRRIVTVELSLESISAATTKSDSPDPSLVEMNGVVDVFDNFSGILITRRPMVRSIAVI